MTEESNWTDPGPLLPTFTIHTEKRWLEIGHRTAEVLPQHLAGHEPVFLVQLLDGRTDDDVAVYEWDGVELHATEDQETIDGVAQMFWDRRR